MNRRHELAGQTFGRLTVQNYAGKDSNGGVFWLCVCSCGVKTKVLGGSLRSHLTTSCGCFRKEQATKANTKHGHATRVGKRTSTYRSWQHMVDRCCNARSDHWKFYGAKGIRVCK